MVMTGSGFVYSAGFVLCAALVSHAWRRHRLRDGYPLPPGPIGLPFIGNVFSLDSVRPWLSYEQWGKQYGPVLYANLLGKDLIIINTAKVAHDLLDRRSAIYSDRPYMPANEMFGVDFNTGLLPYGDKWRLHRKLYNSALHRQKATQYKPLALRRARQLVENLLDAPEDYARHCQTFAAATLMAMIFGYEVAPTNDPFVTKIERLMHLALDVLTPGRTALLLAFPFLAHIPPWFPGGEYKQRAAECRALAEEVLTSPFEYVVKSMLSSTASESFVRGLLEQQNSKMNEDIIKAVATTAYAGGAESTDSTLRVFLLAMVLHPEIQAEAQEEIDRVIGSGRLPDFDDRPNLPYIEAVYLETLRWRPIPATVPRMTTESDVYEGMYIPKGSIVLVNIWAMSHDETQFDDPKAFIPKRHLTSTGALAGGPAHYNFGFGRRICPGRYIADQNVWAAIVTILATLRIAKPRDEFGNEIDVKEEFTGGALSVPKPFMCSITPRFPRVENLIRMRNDT